MFSSIEQIDWITAFLIFWAASGIISILTIAGALISARESITSRYTKEIMKKYGVWAYIRRKTWFYTLLEYLECLIPGLNIVVMVICVLRLDDLEFVYDRVAITLIRTGARRNVERKLAIIHREIQQKAEAEP